MSEKKKGFVDNLCIMFGCVKMLTCKIVKKNFTLFILGCVMMLGFIMLETVADIILEAIREVIFNEENYYHEELNISPRVEILINPKPSLPIPNLSKTIKKLVSLENKVEVQYKEHDDLEGRFNILSSYVQELEIELQ